MDSRKRYYPMTEEECRKELLKMKIRRCKAKIAKLKRVQGEEQEPEMIPKWQEVIDSWQMMLDKARSEQCK